MWLIASALYVCVYHKVCQGSGIHSEVMHLLIGPFPLSHFKFISCPLAPNHLFHKFPQNCKSTWKLCTFLREALPIATPHFRLVGKKIKHQSSRQNVMLAVNFSTNLKYVQSHRDMSCQLCGGKVM